MKFNKSILASLLIVFAGSVFAGPTINLQPAQKLKLPAPVLKPNLVIDTVSWSGEFCGLYGCDSTEQIKRDLKINKATCHLNVRIRNTGAAPTGAFVVQLKFTHWKGTAIIPLTKAVGAGLAAGAGAVISFTPEQIGYYHTGAPFKATVDSANQVQETNESDNTMQMNNP